MIEQIVKRLARAYKRLNIVARNYAARERALREKYDVRIAKLAGAVNAETAALKAAIQANPAEFKQPKTRTLLGVRFGLQKGKGAMEIPDEERTIALIRKHLPGLTPTLITTTTVVSKAALSGLTATELKRIGVEVVDATDAPFIKPADTAAGKIIRAAMKAAGEA